MALDVLELTYGYQRFDRNDPPIFIVHGTADNTVLFSEAEALKNIYESNDLSFSFNPLEGIGHGAWNAMINGKRLEELAFDFIVEQQKLIVK